MAEGGTGGGDDGKSATDKDWEVPMNFVITDRPLDQIEKLVKAGYKITKDVYGIIRVIGRVIIKGNKKDDPDDVSK